MIDKCFITKRSFDKSFKLIPDPDFRGYKYYFKPVGNVYISQVATIVLENNEVKVSILAGMCRYAYELKEKPPIIDSELVNSLDSLKDIPTQFNEKYNHFLKILYKIGGSEYKARDIDVENDYPLAFADDINEFQRIINFAIKSGDLECTDSFGAEDSGMLFYLQLKFTPTGLKKVDKLLNNFFSLMQPKIDSGNSEVNRKINHAVSMFYQENATIEDKRSACEELSFILEPFRKDMGKYFVDKDVKLFFQLVNEFDIRHNKTSTKKLIYDEQVEWIFNSLMNTLNTYIRLKKRFA